MAREYLACALALALVGCGYMRDDAAPITAQDPDAWMRMTRITLDGHHYFMSGINLAWNNWSNDSSPDRLDPNPRRDDGSILRGYDPGLFEEVFRSIEAAGGNALRLWVHCDGRYTPLYDEQGIPIGMPEGSLDNLSDMLSRAAAHQVRILFSLWSFGMKGAGHGNVVTDVAAIQSYITNVLTPMVTTAKDSPGLFGWEICNEPQFMTQGYSQPSSRTPGLAKNEVLRWHALLAAAIHRADPAALVTTGDMFPEISPTMTVDGSNHYSDGALAAAAGGDPLAKLDFYEFHNYGVSETAPWTHNVSFYNLDKPVILGEFEASGLHNWPPEKMYTWAHDQGYAGALSWAYLDNRSDETGTFEDAAPGMMAVYALDPESIRPVPKPVPEAGPDAEPDVSVDAAPEAEAEAAAEDVAAETGPEAAAEDAEPDESVPDVSVDAEPDAEADAEPDQGADDAEAGD